MDDETRKDGDQQPSVDDEEADGNGEIEDSADDLSPAQEQGREEPNAADDPEGRGHLLMLLVAFIAALITLYVIASNESYDAYLCETDDDCRGSKACIEGHCWNPEVWERRSSDSQPVPAEPGEESPPAEAGQGE